MADGLPSNSIRQVFKDSRGLIWIGTDAGLCSFDGKHFRIFTAADGFTADYVWAIAEDEWGTMWFGSYGQGLLSYNGYTFRKYDIGNGLSNNWVRTLHYSTRHHCLLIGTEKGLNIRKDGMFLALKNSPVKQQELHTITGFTEARDFIYVISYGANPRKYYPVPGIIIAVDKTDGRIPQHSSCIMTGSTGDTLWGNARQGLNIIDHKTNKMTFLPALSQIFGLAEDSYKNYWIASWSYNNELPSGVFRYDGHKLEAMNESMGINSHEVWNLYYDKDQGLLWVSTLDEGIFLLMPGLCGVFKASSFGLSSLDIKDLCFDKDKNLWIAATHNLLIRHPDGSARIIENKKVLSAILTSYRNMGLKPAQYPKQLIGMLTSQEVEYNTLSNDSKGNIYVSMEMGTLKFRDAKPDDFIYFPLAAKAEIAFNSGDTLYYGGWNDYGIALLEDRGGRTGSIIKLQPKHRFTEVQRIVTRGREVWYGSWTHGLAMGIGLNFTNFKKAGDVPDMNIKDITFAADNSIIFGSNQGVIHLARHNNKALDIYQSYHQKDGLKGNSISWLLTDKKKYLWAATNTGLNRIDISAGRDTTATGIHYYDKAEGFSALNSKRAVLDEAGMIWTGGSGGLMMINTNAIDGHHRTRTKVQLTNVDINHKAVISSYLDAASWNNFRKPVSLNHHDNSFIFYFDVLNYLNPDKDLFRYKLQGYEKSWTTYSTDRRAIYTNLKPGKYSLLIESVNTSGGQKSDTAIVAFVIRPPWYFSWYFVVFGLGLLISLAFMLDKIHTRNIRKEEQEKAAVNLRINELEMKALQSQMNPHFIFNTLNSIQNLIMRNDVDSSLRYLSDFAKITRMSLDNITRSSISLKDSTDFLQCYIALEQMRFPGKINIHFEVAPGINLDQLVIPPFILQPFVENAINHGLRYKEGPGNIAIKIREAGTAGLLITIEDDGVGRRRAAELYDGQYDNQRLHGTQITESRLRLLNKAGEAVRYKAEVVDLYDETGKGCGTRVEITLPSGNFA